MNVEPISGWCGVTEQQEEVRQEQTGKLKCFFMLVWHHLVDKHGDAAFSTRVFAEGRANVHFQSAVLNIQPASV